MALRHFGFRIVPKVVVHCVHGDRNSMDRLISSLPMYVFLVAGLFRVAYSHGPNVVSVLCRIIIYFYALLRGCEKRL